MTEGIAALVALPRGRDGKILKWYVDKGDRVHRGQRLAMYETDGNRKELKCPAVGTVADVIVQEGGSCKANSPVISIAEDCPHELVVGNLCAKCGTDVSIKHFSETAVDKVDHVAMIHGLPQLRVSKAEAEKIAEQDKQSLLAQRKLVLILDLDQTLIHATTALYVEGWLDDPDTRPEDLHCFTLAGSPIKYFVRVRPHVRELLNGLYEKYELHIYTMGTRAYARTVARILDESGKLFGDRILSRDDGFDQNFKAPTLKSLFPCGDTMVVILDDREDVWQGAPNLVRVTPYVYFAGVPDVNATPLDIINLRREEAEQRTIDAAVSDGAGQAQVNGASATSPSDTQFKLRSAISRDLANLPSDQIPDADIRAWRDMGSERAFTSLMDLLQVKQYRNAALRLRAVRTAFVTAADDHQAQTYGRSVDDDLDTLVRMASLLPPTPAPPAADKDDILVHMLAVLKTIHQAFYGQVDQGFTPDVRVIMPALKQDVLSGCYMVLSGIIPTDLDPHQNETWNRAESFGAVCERELSDETTHVVATRITAKVRQAMAMPGVCIVRLDWLRDTMATWTRKDEQEYALQDVPVFREGQHPTRAHQTRRMSARDIESMDAEVDELLGDMTEEEDTLGASAAFNKDDDDVEISDIEIDEDELREGLQSDSSSSSSSEESASESSSSEGEGEPDNEDDESRAPSDFDDSQHATGHKRNRERTEQPGDEFREEPPSKRSKQQEGEWDDDGLNISDDDE